MKFGSEEKKMRDSKARLRWLFVLCVAVVLLVSFAIMVTLEYIIVKSGLVPQELLENLGILWILIFCFTSIAVGLGVAALLSRTVLNPINTIIDGMSKLAAGDYSTRINLGKYDAMKNVADKFNSMATELQNTEILRSDFVNNFSHEFKTPIVSIHGFIELMKDENLPLEKRERYINVIEEEVNRLTDMTTNILNFSKIENQEILTDKTEFNLSEQIRTCVVLLEKKWEKKKLSLSLDFGEHTVCGNEEMLKQVWINLIDNAVKFSEKGSELKIDVSEWEDGLHASFENTGVPIAEEDYEKIFGKFYQCDRSGREGNGIGLSIVKRVVDLHGGSVSVKSEGGRTAFTVFLPKHNKKKHGRY